MLRKLRDAIREFFGALPAKIKTIAAQSLQVTTAIKSILSNPVADVVTAIIPGDWDDALKATVLQAIEKALPYLQIVDNCKHHTNVEDMLKCWVAEVAKLPKHAQNAMLHKLASLLMAQMHNNELKQSLYDYYQQAYYSSQKEWKAA